MSPDLSRVRRLPDRQSSERADLDALLDAELVGTLSTVVDGEPWSVPMLLARDGDRVLLHGSTGAGLLRHVAAGAPVTLAVTRLEGVVVAHSGFDSSVNYRSAVLRGRLDVLTGPDGDRALDILVDHVIPGRTGEIRANLPKERAATVVLALPVQDWVYKARSAPAGAPDEETDAWYGVVPLRTVAGDPEPDAGCTAEMPGSVERLRERYR